MPTALRGSSGYFPGWSRLFTFPLVEVLNNTTKRPAQRRDGPGEAQVGIRLFDLNIEEVLENWEIHHAIREVIANALDEQLLTSSGEPRIAKEPDGWHVRDFGRGIRIEHFTQNENPEKLRAPAGVIGKFGVGLKDALATFHRYAVDVTLQSRFGTFTVRPAEKSGFAGISTLHVEYNDVPLDLEGTDVALRGVRDEDVAAAKTLFLRFSEEASLEITPHGEVLARRDAPRVYINGVFADEEPNFLFTYNVTSLTPTMRKKLNRERLNVGRTTYTERVVSILKQAKSESVRDALIAEALKAKGDQHDEMQWVDISQLALNLLSAKQTVSFVTESQLQEHPDVVDNMRRDGYEVVVVGEGQQARLQQQIESGGPPVRTFHAYLDEYNASFQYRFVDLAQLRPAERAVFELTPKLLRAVGIPAERAPRVRISETIRVSLYDTGGVWDSAEGAIVVKRSQLASPTLYAATLLHELAHATTATVDVTREFEQVLTDYLGKTGSAALGN